MNIAVSELTKSYGSVKVFSNLSFRIDTQEIVSIVGPTGCGKTTLLNLIAKIDQQDSGDINFDGKGEYRVGYMMQDTLLLPWRTLAENALLGLEVSNPENPTMSDTLDYYLDAFDLQGYENNYPNALSGGMKQRAALIRTLLPLPSVFLLDEPFTNLDFDIKLKIQRHLIGYHMKAKATTMLVTHDIEDAIALSDKVIVLSGKPATVKTEIIIDLGIKKRDPVEARKSPKFREYFIQIWDELKYLNNDD